MCMLLCLLNCWRSCSACVPDFVEVCTGNLSPQVVLIMRLEVSTLSDKHRSFSFSSFLLGLDLILVLSHQLLHPRHCPASLPHKVSLEECANNISCLLRERLLFLICVVLVLCRRSITKIAVAAIALCRYAGLCPVMHRNPGHLPFS